MDTHTTHLLAFVLFFVSMSSMHQSSSRSARNDFPSVMFFFHLTNSYELSVSCSFMVLIVSNILIPDGVAHFTSRLSNGHSF